jgi:predicted nucleotide-binding protein
MLGTTTATATKVFIVHGRDMATAFEVKNYLQNTLKLPEPIILQEQPSYGRTIIEKFEDTARGCELVFVLLTPDDIMANTDASNDDKWRSRQNVIFEMGYFFGILGRLSGRVLLLHKGKIDLPSDIDGLVYIDITAGISAAGDTIRKEIKDVIS